MEKVYMDVLIRGCPYSIFFWEKKNNGENKNNLVKNFIGAILSEKRPKTGFTYMYYGSLVNVEEFQNFENFQI